VSVRADGGRTELVVERTTTVQAVVDGVNALVFLCPAELRSAALAEVARLSATDPHLIGPPAGVHEPPAGR
jgi:hypothetical protein